MDLRTKLVFALVRCRGSACFRWACWRTALRVMYGAPGPSGPVNGSASRTQWSAWPSSRWAPRHPNS